MNHPLSREFARITSQSIGLLDSLKFLSEDLDTGKYPPYNIIQQGPNYFLELAVAGFRKKELSVTVDKDILTITGQQVDDNPDVETAVVDYLHRGISTRAFTRTFKLGEHVEVTDVTYEDGILKVSMNKNEPEPDIRKFDIK